MHRGTVAIFRPYKGASMGKFNIKSFMSPSVKRQGSSFSLSSAKCGERLRVVGVRQNSPESQRLAELGFCERAEICKLVDGGLALICMLNGVRLAMARTLGADVIVELV